MADPAHKEAGLRRPFRSICTDCAQSAFAASTVFSTVMPK